MRPAAAAHGFGNELKCGSIRDMERRYVAAERLYESKGQALRGEMTDAAVPVRAECTMLKV